jgi:hypothetical protein
MDQGSLDFGRDYRVTEAQRALMRALNDAVDAVSLIVAAGACGCRTPELSDALAGRQGRYMRVEWVLAIADIAPSDFKHSIATALVSWMGLRIEAGRKLKPEEKLARLEERVARRFGEAGAALVEEMRR